MLIRADLLNGKLTVQHLTSLNLLKLFSPKFYCLPKIHKPDIPLRPIGSPMYLLAKFLTSIISPLAGNTITHVKKLITFLEI